MQKKSDSREPDHSYIKPTSIPATYTGNWCRLLLSNTSQAGWMLHIALAALGVIVTLSQKPPPDTPVPPSNMEHPTCLAGA